MVRFALLAALVAACLAAAPAAHAALVPADVQSAAAAPLQQAGAVTGVATSAAGAVRPPARQLGATASHTTGGAAPAADPAVGSAAGLAEPAVEQAEYATAVAAAAKTAADGSGKLHESPSSTPDRAARFTSPGQGHTGSSAAHDGGRAALANLPPAATPQSHPKAGVPVDPGTARTFAPRRPAAPDRLPSSVGGGAASAPPAGLSFGGLALLAMAVCLAGPRLCRRLLIQPAALRPVAFVALLERPG
jgi:hypothetical protein